LRYFSTIASTYGDVVCYRPAPDTAYLINHPDYVRHVLVDNNRNYSKETHTNQQFNEVVAEGLLTTEGDVWRKQRRMMQPAFHRTRLELLDTMITAATEDMLRRWQELHRLGQPVDIASEMAGLTLTSTGRCLASSLEMRQHEIGRMVNGVRARKAERSERAAMDRLDEVVQRSSMSAA
jgi:cytochrome P450